MNHLTKWKAGRGIKQYPLETCLENVDCRFGSLENELYRRVVA